MIQPNLTVHTSSTFDTSAAEKIMSQLEMTRKEIMLGYFGSAETVDLALTTLLAAGHTLLSGSTGTGKAALIKTFGHVLNLNVNFISCTPDQKNADIFAAVLQQASKSTSPNPTNATRPQPLQAATGHLLVLTDLDRATPQVRATVSHMIRHGNFMLAGRTYLTPAPFHVLAIMPQRTEDDLYLLPESGLDQFLLQIDFPLPSRDEEKRILLRTLDLHQASPCRRMNPPDLLVAQQLAQELPIDEHLLDTALLMVRQTRPESSSLEVVKKYVTSGPSPRALHHLIRAIRAYALVKGRVTSTSKDMLLLAPFVLGHRLLLSLEAQSEGITPQKILNTVLASLPLSQNEPNTF